MQKFICNSVAETEELGATIAKKLTGGEVLALFGGMGLGKTAFTRGIAQGLQVKQGVSSPTFAIVHEYNGHHKLYHFDMFRVESFEDLYSTGFFDYLDTDAILIIEWSENIENVLPENAIRIDISMGEQENQRIFEVQGESI